MNCRIAVKLPFMQDPDLFITVKNTDHFRIFLHAQIAVGSASIVVFFDLLKEIFDKREVDLRIIINLNRIKKGSIKVKRS